MRFPGSSMMDVALNTKGIFTCPPYFQRQTEKLLQNYWPTDIIIIKNVYIYIHIYVPSRNHRHFCGLFFFKALLNDTFITPFLRSMANSALNRLKHTNISFSQDFLFIFHHYQPNHCCVQIFSKNLIPARTILSAMNIKYT